MLALLIAAAAAASQSAPAAAPRSAPAIAPSATNPAAAAQIRRLEHEWGQAFVRRDLALIERIVAPEYRLAVALPDGGTSVTLREEWMRNTRDFEISAFAIEIVDVMTAGDTAVALVQGLWTVKTRPDRPAETRRFIVTDTWVRRNRRWQVVYRYSHRLPGASWPPPAQGDVTGRAQPRP